MARIVETSFNGGRLRLANPFTARTDGERRRVLSKCDAARWERETSPPSFPMVTASIANNLSGSHEKMRDD
jgi:hypothetical protein